MATKKSKKPEGGYNTLRNRIGHFTLGFVLVIAGPVFSIYFLPRVLEGRASENWPTAKAKITDAKLVETQNILGQYFETKVRYTFEVDGKKFNGDRLKIGGKSTSNEKDAEAELRRYGERAGFIEVRYNPSDPNHSTVETGATTGNLVLVAVVGPAILLFGVFLLGIGILMALLARNRTSDDEESEDEDDDEDRPKAKKGKSKIAQAKETAPKKAKRQADEQEEEEEPPAKKAKRRTSDDDEEPPRKRKSQ
jgi:hypothetical protein